MGKVFYTIGSHCIPFVLIHTRTDDQISKILGSKEKCSTAIIMYIEDQPQQQKEMLVNR